MYALLKTKDRINEIKAIGMYYILYSDIMPHLQTVTPATHNPALISAIEKIAEKNGFHSTTYFRKIFGQYIGISPAKYRKQVIKNKQL